LSEIPLFTEKDITVLYYTTVYRCVGPTSTLVTFTITCLSKAL